jgi:multidrug efflux pump subunit AcrB
MSRFFINRPIVAIVISILMVIVGAITITIDLCINNAIQ